MIPPEASSLLNGFARWKNSVDILWRGVGHRTELAGLEWREARSVVCFAALLAASAMLLLLLAGIAFTLLVAAVYWDTPHRVMALAWLGVGEILAAAGAITWVWFRWRHWRAFAATREQLEHDSKCLQDLIQTGGN